MLFAKRCDFIIKITNKYIVTFLLVITIIKKCKCKMKSGYRVLVRGGLNIKVYLITPKLHLRKVSFSNYSRSVVPSDTECPSCKTPTTQSQKNNCQPEWSIHWVVKWTKTGTENQNSK
jgi:hypothetical protein